MPNIEHGPIYVRLIQYTRVYIFSGDLAWKFTANLLEMSKVVVSQLNIVIKWSVSGGNLAQNPATISCFIWAPSDVTNISNCRSVETMRLSWIGNRWTVISLSHFWIAKKYRTFYHSILPFVLQCNSVPMDRAIQRHTQHRRLKYNNIHSVPTNVAM